MDTDWRAEFEDLHGAAVARRGARLAAVFGDEYPEASTRSLHLPTELARFAGDDERRAGRHARRRRLRAGRAGLWVAMATGARLVGIDIAESALEAARGASVAPRADARSGKAPSRRRVSRPGPRTRSPSVDAFLFTPDKAAGMVELRRVLRRLGGW
jgi:hypothetical protein